MCVCTQLNIALYDYNHRFDNIYTGVRGGSRILERGGEGGAVADRRLKKRALKASVD